jgi:hypothetical protein
VFGQKVFNFLSRLKLYTEGAKNIIMPYAVYPPTTFLLDGYVWVACMHLILF